MKLNKSLAANAVFPIDGFGASAGVSTAPKTFADISASKEIQAELHDALARLRALAPVSHSNALRDAVQ